MRKSKNSKTISSWWNNISEVDSQWSSPVSKCEEMWYSCCLILFLEKGSNNETRRGIQVPVRCCLCSLRLKNEYTPVSPYLQIYLLFLSLLMWDASEWLWTILHHFPSPSGSSGSQVTLLSLRMYRVVIIRIFLLNVIPVLCRI